MQIINAKKTDFRYIVFFEFLPELLLIWHPIKINCWIEKKFFKYLTRTDVYISVIVFVIVYSVCVYDVQVD